MFYILFIVVFARPVTVLLHEMGHGLTALVLSRGKVSLFLGSYGDRAKGIRIGLGRMELYVSSGIYYRGSGLCMVDAPMSVRRQMLFTLMGPVTSLIAGILFFWWATSPASDEVTARLAFFCALSCIIDLLINIVPRKRPIVLADGRLTHNDGRQLFVLWVLHKHWDTYCTALERFHAGAHAESARLFHTIVRKEKRLADLFRYAVHAHLMAREFANARMLLKEQEERWPLEANDLVNRAYIKIEENEFQDALSDMDRALEMQPGHALALSNRGFTHELLGDHDRAHSDLDRAIALDPNCAYAYNNRALVRIRTGHMQEAHADLEKAFALDGKHAYMHRNRGIYHFELGAYAEALACFEQAAVMDTDVRDLTAYLERTRALLPS